METSNFSFFFFWDSWYYFSHNRRTHRRNLERFLWILRKQQACRVGHYNTRKQFLDNLRMQFDNLRKQFDNLRKQFDKTRMQFFDNLTFRNTLLGYSNDNPIDSISDTWILCIYFCSKNIDGGFSIYAAIENILVRRRKLPKGSIDTVRSYRCNAVV